MGKEGDVRLVGETLLHDDDEAVVECAWFENAVGTEDFCGFVAVGLDPVVVGSVGGQLQ